MRVLLLRSNLFVHKAAVDATKRSLDTCYESTTRLVTSQCAALILAYVCPGAAVPKVRQSVLPFAHGFTTFAVARGAYCFTMHNYSGR